MHRILAILVFASFMGISNVASAQTTPAGWIVKEDTANEMAKKFENVLAKHRRTNALTIRKADLLEALNAVTGDSVYIILGNYDDGERVGGEERKFKNRTTFLLKKGDNDDYSEYIDLGKFNIFPLTRPKKNGKLYYERCNLCPPPNSCGLSIEL
jgi:hypothetical protein